MSVNAVRVINPPADDCYVCQDSLEDGQEVFDHEGVFGNRHLVHKKCMLGMLQKNQGKCGVCRVSINENSLYSLKEMKAITREIFYTNTLSGIVHSLILGGALHLLFPHIINHVSQIDRPNTLWLGAGVTGVVHLFAFVGMQLGLEKYHLERHTNGDANIKGAIVGALSGYIPYVLSTNASLPLIFGTIATVGALTAGAAAIAERKWEWIF